jgi:hypothetical protein
METKMNVESYVKLSDNENEVCRLRGNAYTLSTNPLVRFVMFFVKIVQFLIGAISKVAVIVTSERVIVVNNQRFLWFFDASVEVKTYYPRGIVMTGYRMERTMIFFKTHFLSVSIGPALELFSSKDGENRVHEMITAIKALKEKTSGI